MDDGAIRRRARLFGDAQREQGTTGAGAHDQQIVLFDGRLGNLAHIMRLDAQVRQPLAHALQRQHHPAHTHKEHLISFEYLIP